MIELNENEAEKAVATVGIPPRPAVVAAIMEERERDDPDVRKIAQLIGADVALAAAVIKTVNSPFYAPRRKITSIDQAVALLGLKNVSSLVTSLALAQQVPAEGLGRFWDETTRTAYLCVFIARQIGRASIEDAQIYGLFANCGIPLMMRRYEGYKDTLAQANAAPNGSFTSVEDARHGTNHAVVGRILAKNWQLDEHIREAIWHHHELDSYTTVMADKTRDLIAIGHLADHIENTLSNRSYSPEWDKLGATSLKHLLIGERELAELTKDARDILDEADFI